jgi:hypothetical protein
MLTYFSLKMIGQGARRSTFRFRGPSESDAKLQQLLSHRIDTELFPRDLAR